MTMYDFVWLCMTMYDFVWLCCMYDYIRLNVWLCMTMYDYVCLCMNVYEYVWLCMTMFYYCITIGIIASLDISLEKCHPWYIVSSDQWPPWNNVSMDRGAMSPWNNVYTQSNTEQCQSSPLQWKLHMSSSSHKKREYCQHRHWTPDCCSSRCLKHH